MTTATVAFAVALAAAWLSTPLARSLAHRIGAIDHALSSRKVHQLPIPRLGGIAIVGAFFAALAAILVADPAVVSLFSRHRGEAIGLILGGALIAGLGIYDDLRGAGSRAKFVVQFAVAAFAYVMGYRIDVIATPFGAPIQLGALGLPFTMLWVAGVINAINLIDGLDGLAGGVALIAAGTTFVAAVLRGDAFMVVTAAALAGALLGFLRYNFNPASIFMGDTGSMFLGFVLATSAIHSHAGPSTEVSLLVPVLALALPLTDTLLAMARRYVRGAPLFQADRAHIHHRLLARGLSHRRTVLVLYGASVVSGAVALLVAAAPVGISAPALGGFALTMTALLYRLGFMRLDRAAEVLEARRRNLELRANLRGAAARLKDASEIRVVWETVAGAVRTLGARSVILDVISENARGARRTRRFADDAGRGEAPLRTRHALLVERPDAGFLELSWGDHIAQLDRDTELAVELLCRHVHGALARIGREIALGQRQRRAAGAVNAWELDPDAPSRIAAQG